MSLHIGRLSRDVEKRYLENIFQKFGRCTIRMKNGYGFAVYDANDDAARAMRVLNGKYVCGERITVHWSKHQPRSFDSFMRSLRFVESSHQRTSRDGVDNFKFIDSIAQKNHSTSHGQNPDPDHALEKKHDEIAEVLKNSGENNGRHPGNMKDEGGISDANAIEHDRWGETGKGNPDRDADDFDQYEPYHGYDRQDKTKKAVQANFCDSHDLIHSSEKRQEHPTECFDLNHTAHNWPQESDGKFKAWRNGLGLKGKQELRLRRSRSPSRRHNRIKDDKKQFSDRSGRMLRLTNKSRDNKRNAPHNESMLQDPKEARKRRWSNRSCLLSLSSDRTSPYSRSRSSQSCSRSCSREHLPSNSAHSSSKSSQPTQHEGLRLNMDAPITSVKLDTQSNGEPLVPSKNDKMAGYTEANLDNNLVHGDTVANGLQGQKTNLEDISSVKPDQKNLVNYGRGNSLNLTTTEVVSALKSNGMEAHEVGLLNQPVERYFGAARLWPWEIIYYRRCKKGPISTENYAKRLEQNKEYGIGDQYVRSSSGWWECQ